MVDGNKLLVVHNGKIVLGRYVAYINYPGGSFSFQGVDYNEFTPYLPNYPIPFRIENPGAGEFHFAARYLWGLPGGDVNDHIGYRLSAGELRAQLFVQFAAPSNPFLEYVYVGSGFGGVFTFSHVNPIAYPFVPISHPATLTVTLRDLEFTPAFP